jgi:hypothetical protein
VRLAFESLLKPLKQSGVGFVTRFGPVFHKGNSFKKKKEPKKKKKSLWKLPQLWKSTKEAFGNFFLMISTAAWKSLRENRSGFPTVTTGPAATVPKTRTSIFR